MQISRAKCTPVPFAPTSTRVSRAPWFACVPCARGAPTSRARPPRLRRARSSAHAAFHAGLDRSAARHPRPMNVRERRTVVSRLALTDAEPFALAARGLVGTMCARARRALAARSRGARALFAPHRRDISRSHAPAESTRSSATVGSRSTASTRSRTAEERKPNCVGARSPCPHCDDAFHNRMASADANRRAS